MWPFSIMFTMPDLITGGLLQCCDLQLNFLFFVLVRGKFDVWRGKLLDNALTLVVFYYISYLSEVLYETYILGFI